jgi:hypothetical protein
MKFEIIIEDLNQILKEKKPEKFDTSWIEINATSVYQYVCENIRTENNDVDWDKVTSRLDRPFQRRWIWQKQKDVKYYQCRSEVDAILNKYKDKLYTFLAPMDESDKHIQHWIIIGLVRIGQKGNTLVQEEIIKWIIYIVYDWIDRYPQIRRWKGYSDEIEGKIKGCIRCYRYTGSFLTYLFRTLEYSTRGKPPLYSLDEPTRYGKETRVDFLII